MMRMVSLRIDRKILPAAQMDELRSILIQACRASDPSQSIDIRSAFEILFEQGLAMVPGSHEVQIRAELLRDRADEELRNHAFHDVSLDVRQRYELACLFQTLILFEKDRIGSETALECIQVLDMALLMTGCPRYRPLTFIIIQSLHSIMKEFPISRANIVPRDVPKILHSITSLYQPSVSEFEKHLISQAPIIIKGMTDCWPCLSSREWKDLNYFSKIAGHRTVPVEIGLKYTDDDWTQKLMPFHQVLQDISSPNSKTYLAQFDLMEHIPELRKDILVPDYCYSTDQDPLIHVWLGPDGTVSPCHHDPYENIFAQIVGFKYVRLYSPEQKLYPYGEGTMLSNSSQVRVSWPFGK